MLVIYSDKIVQNDAVISGYIHIADGKIQKIDEKSSLKEYIDMTGKYILPGLINIKSEHISRENQIKLNSRFPFAKIFREVEIKYASAGITTLFHSIPLVNGRYREDFTTGPKMAKDIKELSKNSNLIDHRIHMAFQLGFIQSMDKIKEMLESNLLDYISYSGYCRSDEERYREIYYEDYIQRVMGLSEATCRRMVERVRELRSESNLEELAYMLKYAHYKGVKVGTSELSVIKKLEFLEQQGINIIENPSLEEALNLDSDSDKMIMMDILSLSKQLNKTYQDQVVSAIRTGHIDILSSDMRAHDILAFVFQLAQDLGLEKAVSLVTSNPATALKLKDRGQIKENLRADLIVVDILDEVPVVEMTISNGKIVYRANY